MGKTLKTVAIIAAAVAVAYFAPQISVALLGSTAAAGTIAAVGASLALSTASMALFGPKIPKTQISRLNVSLDPSTPRKAVFGTTAMPLDLRYHESSGTNQEYVDYIVAVAAHKVTSITEIWFEEKQAWTVGGGVTATYSGYLTVAVRTEGTSGNTIAINGGGKWGSSRRLTGCAYLHIRIKRTGNTKKAESPLASGLPSRVTVIGDGALLYDPRKDSTVPGGSGSHRATDQATWGAYTNADDTDNPALQLLWWLLGWEINNKLSVGCGVPYTRIDMPSFITAANICDENVTLAIGGTQKRYRTSGTASDADDRMEIINNLLASMNGTLRDNGGKLTLTAMKNDLADYVLTFDENDMIGGFDWQQTRGLTENYNVVRGRYVDPSNNSLYQMVDYPEVGFASPDGIERVMSLDLPYIEDGRRAQRIAKQVIQRNQYRGLFSATFNAKALGCQVGDVVRMNLEALGWSNKPFRVVSQEIRFDGQVPLALVEENAAIYAWDADDVAPITPTAPTIYDPLNSPFILGIDDAGTTAEWSGIIDDNGDKPEDNATRNVNRGAWSGSSVAYSVGDFVQLDGSSYSAIVAHTSTAGNGPPGANWALLAAGGGGDIGPPGAAAISGYLTKETVQLFAYANGGVVSYAPASGSFKVFSGNTDVSSSFSLTTLSNPEALTVSYSSQTYSVTAGFDANEDTASVTIRATGSGTYVGVTIDKVFSLSKAKGGYEIVATLPLTDLFEGRVVFLTSDDKLYRYTGAAWTSAVPAVDITGTLADAQIAALAASKVTGQLSDAQLAAIAAAKVTGQLTDTQIADLAATKVTGQLTDAQIAAIAAAKVTGQIVNTQIEAVAAAKVTGQLTDAQIADLASTKVTGQLTDAQIAAIAATKVTGQIVNTQIEAIAATKVTGQLSDAQIEAVAAAKVTGQITNVQIAAVDVTKLTGQIISTQITDDAITSDKIAANAVTANEIAANAVVAGKIAADSITANEIAANAITASEIAANAVVAGKIAADAVTANEIAANAVVAGKIAADAVTANEIAANSITSSEIAANAVVAGKIAADAVTANEIAAGAVVAGKIAANAVTASEIAANAVVAGKIAANAVTANEIAADAITASEIAAGAVTAGKIAADAVTANEIAANSITSSEIAANAVIAGKIAADAVTANEIAANAVTASEIAAGAVVAGKIAANAVTATEIAAGAITTAKIAANAVTANEIAANTITAAKIAAGAITSNEIAANTITAADIAASTITATEIAGATITGAKIAAGTIAAGNIAANTITASEIAANTITAAQIASNAITADEIAAGAVTAAKISVTELSAITATIGTLRTATTGARLEIESNQIRVYDSSNVLRVRLGVW